MRVVSVFLVVSLVLISAAAFADKPMEKPKFFTRQSLDCSNATRVSCGTQVQGDNTGAPNNVTTYSCTSWNESGGEVVFELSWPTGICNIVSAALSGMTGDLDVFILGSCDEGQCLAYGDATATSTCLVGGTYYIVVDGYGGAQSAFTLTVTCTECTCPSEPPVNNTCDGAIEVFDGTNLNGDLTNATNNYDPGSGGCTGYAAAGKDVTYKITVGAGDEISATMVPTGFDGSFYLVTDCSDVAGTCVVGSDNCCSGATEDFVYCSEGGGTYYIICDAYGTGGGGAFTLSVTVGDCSAPPEPCGYPSHDTCAEAVTFCGDVVVRCIDTNYLMANDLDPGSGGCTGYAAVGPDVVYKVVLLPGGSITASMDPIEYFDAAIYLITDCGDPVGSCVVGDDSGNPEAITYTSEGGGIYYLVADAYGSTTSGGTFLLEITIIGGGPSAVEKTTWGGMKALYK